MLRPFSGPTPVSAVQGPWHVGGGAGVHSPQYVSVCPRTRPVGCWSVGMLGDKNPCTLPSVRDLTCWALFFREPQCTSIVKVSLLHVTPGMECETGVDVPRLWTWTGSGSGPAAPFQPCDLGPVTDLLLASVSLSVRCDSPHPADPAHLL